MWLAAFVHVYIYLYGRFVQGIDGNEKLGRCFEGFTVDVNYYMNEMEGIWFPQYRPRDPDNREYTSCHTLYEQMDREDGKFKLVVDSYYTINKTVDKNPYTVSYSSGHKRGILVDTEEVHDHGKFHIFNFILKKTKDFRVRYVCTDFQHAIAKHPVVYIETRSMTPKLEVINKAVKVIRRAGFKKRVVLEKINQKNCTRPLSYKGYDEDSAANG